jgi:peptide/nickel transport system substrate-binding protein
LEPTFGKDGIMTQSERDDLVSTVTSRRLNRRRLAGGAAGVGAAAMAAKVGLAPQAAKAQDDDANTLKLTLGASTNVDLNPIGIRTLGAFYLQSCIYDGLVMSSPDWNSVEPGLSETYDVSEDGLVYTFHLRQGVKWHDGEDFTADDVVFTYHTMLNQAIGSYMASTMFIVDGAEAYFNGEAETITGIEAVDDHTVTFTLSEPNAPFTFSILTQHSIIPEHVWADVPAEELVKPGTWETGQIGTGPFKFVQYQPDQFLELTRNDEAWRGAPLLDRILFVHVGTTPEATAAALENGDVDYAGALPAAEYERMSELESLTMYSKPVYNVRFLSVNVAKPFLSDKRVRQAFAHAIDRAGIVEAIISYGGVATDNLTPSETWRNPDVATYPFDPEAAQALLAEAGWDAAQEVVVSLYYLDQAHADSIATVQQQLTDIGVNATVLQLDASAVQDYYYGNAEFDVMLGGFGVSPDFDEYSRIFMTDALWPAGQNAMKYSNARVDELFIEGRTTVDEAARKTAYDEVQVILADELPWIPFYNLSLVAGMNKRVQNADAIVNVWNRPYNWNIEKVSISEG